jgi:Icc-related predicted phosphoesterase
MRILHISDTHGRFPELRGDYDCVVHSGDLLPNRTADKLTEPAFQEWWVREKIQRLRGWLGEKPFLLTPGNHDFFDPCPLLRRAGVQAHNLWEEGPKVIGGLRFAGVPHVPSHCPPFWNYEVPEEEIAYHVETALESEPDILVTHCPPFTVLDSVPVETFDRSTAAIHIGSKSLLTALRDYAKGITVLCGHCHECGGGVGKIGTVTVVNSAESQRVVECVPRGEKK